MSINEIERMDTVVATVTKSTLGGGAYLILCAVKAMKR